MIVIKFGGSSLKDAEMIRKSADIVKSKLDKNPIVVLSAVGGVTDQLIECLEQSLENKYDIFEEILQKHDKILDKLKLPKDMLNSEFTELKEALIANSKTKKNDAKILDYITFFGERFSIKIIAAHLSKSGTLSNPHISGDIGLLTDSNFGCAEILKDSYAKIKEKIEKIDGIPIITGFGGKNKNGCYTTFSRGGSDYVAALIGSAINAKVIEIWTDADGIMSADPKVVSSAKTISVLSFDEASELAYFGAKILHPKTILPAIKKNIPVVVKNTYNPDNPGSTIMDRPREKNRAIKAISHKKGISIIDVKSTRMLDTHGYLAKIFSVFERHKKPVDMIATSEINVSISVDSRENIKEIVKELEQISRINVSHAQSIIYLVGAKIKHEQGIVGEIFQILSKNKISVGMISQCSEEISIGFVVSQNDAEKAVKILHRELIR